MIEADWLNLILLGLFWLAYFSVHSALASLRLKSWFALRYPQQMPCYRLGFNLLALLALLPLLCLWESAPLWAWRGLGAWVSNGLAIVALVGFAATLKNYDGRAFIGLRQWKARQAEYPERFRLSHLHRYVRHPWYFLSLLLIWTRDMNAAMLLSCVMMTIYFIIGSRLEDSKLQAAYGESYRRYMARVPGLLPRPGKSLSAKEAAELVAAAGSAS